MRTKHRDRDLRCRRRAEEIDEVALCAGKARYRSQPQAERALGRVRSNIGKWGSEKFPVRVYLCDTGPNPCFCWHLTSVD